MLRSRWIGVVVAAGVLTGCAQQKPPAKAPAESAQPRGTPLTLAAARDELKRANPNTDVGSVVAVYPEANLAAVADMPLAHFRIGDPITFLDGNLNSVTFGTVVAIMNGNLHVRYDAPPPGHRLPQKDDIAVRIFNGVLPAPQSTASGDSAAPAVPAAPPSAPAPAAAPEPTPAAPSPAPAPAPAPSAPPATAPSAPPDLNK